MFYGLHTLYFTSVDIMEIQYVGDKYKWSEMLLAYIREAHKKYPYQWTVNEGAGTYSFSLEEALELVKEMHEIMDPDDIPDPDTPLAYKLYTFSKSVLEAQNQFGE